MAIWCFSKTVFGTTIASAAFIYCIIILHNRKEKKEMDKANNNTVFEIKITNISVPNIYNKRQIFAKNSVNPNNTPLISKIKQIVTPLSKQNASNNPVKPSHNKKLYQIQSKAVEDCNSITQNNIRFLTHSESSETIILNNSASSFEHGFNNAHDNLNHSLVININNSMDPTNNRVQIKVFNRSVKLSTLNMKTSYAFDDPSSNNRSAGSYLIMISQKDEPKEIDIMIPSFNHQLLVEHISTFRGSQLTNACNNKCTKEMERNDVTIKINASNVKIKTASITFHLKEN